jgi:D-alanyl-D-alanine carboxypeptidase
MRFFSCLFPFPKLNLTHKNNRKKPASGGARRGAKSAGGTAAANLRFDTAPQHLNNHAQRNTTQSLVFKCWAFIDPTFVTIFPWSVPAKNSRKFLAPRYAPAGWLVPNSGSSLVSKLWLFVCLLVLFSCVNPKRTNADGIADGKTNDMANSMAGNMAESMANNMADEDNEFIAQLSIAVRNAQLPDVLSQKIQVAVSQNSAFIDDLRACLAEDRHLRELVDKQHPLPPNYVPAGLVTLTDGPYRVNREGLMLRKDAADSLIEMATAARADGITLLASSAYRSYDYQEQVYNRNVREMGQEAADRESARPGHSQHQTGLVVDFGSIDDSFAQTAAGRWVGANSSRFGWSLSFPDGYEAVTGYRWESWHFRYVGKNLAAFIDNYFDGIQQYALQFLHEWEKL